MLPTPSTSHVNYARIYEPAEDSYLLLDTLASDSESTFLRRHFPSTAQSPLVIEVGTGSGVVLAFATAHAEHIFGRRDIATLGMDVNPFACQATVETVRRAVLENADRAGTFIDSLSADLTGALRPGEVDVLIFNPPYVPTESLPENTGAVPEGQDLTSHEEFERDSHLLSLSYAGGTDGMETTNRLLDHLPSVLSSRGVAYVLLCAQNQPSQVIARIHASEGGWKAEKIRESGKTAGWEKLCVLRIWKD